MHPRLRSLEHVRICSARDTLCHWPRFGGLWYWPQENEILLGHIHSHSDYQNPQDKAHGEFGIWQRATNRFQRSLDGGATWPEELAFDLYDNRKHLEEHWQWLGLDPFTRRPLRPNDACERPHIDMTSPDALFYTSGAWCGLPSVQDGRVHHERVLWGLRSGDRGRTWEKHPILLRPQLGDSPLIYNPAYLVLPDGNVLCWFGAVVRGNLGSKGAPQLYLSTDNAVTWHSVSTIHFDANSPETASYARLLLLPSGRLFSSLGMWAGSAAVRWTAVTYSDDLGLTWAPPRRIDRWSVSPFPVLLADGRIVIVYVVRCQPPMRMCCIVSEDEGKTWSPEILLRDDSPPRSDEDAGYPVAAELRDGRIFTGYYWQVQEKDIGWPGGRKHIAGTFFELK